MTLKAGNVKSVGIIVAGRIGRAIAETALRAGRQVVIANKPDLSPLSATTSHQSPIHHPKEAASNEHR
jgi:predicted dinucleotide-binding enzyme